MSNLYYKLEEIGLQSGDIFATRGQGVIGWLNRNLMAPETDRFHFGLVGLKVNDDYLILESIGGKGIAVGRLSFYEGKDIKFYRVDCPSELRLAAPIELTRWGRSKYDYLLIPKLAIQGFWLVLKHLITEGKFRRIRAEELRPIYTWDSRLLCTEAVWCGYNAVGVNIIPYGVPPMPSSFREAELQGRITEVK